MHLRTSRTSKGTIGVDFGTTNSSIACADCLDEVQLAKFPYLGGLTDTYRSLLYLQQTKERGANTLKSWTGPEGIEQYLSADKLTRLPFSKRTQTQRIRLPLLDGGTKNRYH